MFIRVDFVFVMKKQLTFIDFCAWIGWWRLWLEANWLRCLWFSEIDKDAEKTYRLIHNTDEKNYWDLTKINPDDLPDFDFMIAWFPCQTFSIMWERKWMDDERWRIILHLIEIMKKKKIKYFLLENVKWLVNHDHWKTLKKILNLLSEAWYCVNYSVLNSINYWVPQMRERIYIVWFRKDLVDSDFKFEFPKPLWELADLKDFLDNWEYVWKDISYDETFNRYLNNKYNEWKYELKNIIKNNYNVLDTRQSDLRIYEKKVPTIRRWRQWILYSKDWILRKLSWYEAVMLQWFPRNLADKVKWRIVDWNLLKQAGNAMTVNAIQSVVEKMLLYI